MLEDSGLQDPLGWVAALIDSNHNKTEFEYDEGGHLKTKRYADGSELNYQYEKGYIQTETNARGTVKTYRYNEYSQLTGIDYSDGTPSASMSYDRFGRIKSVTDVQGKTVFQHKPNGLVSSIDGPLDNDTIELDYNSVGRLKSVQVGGDSHGAYQYDELGRLQSITAFGKEFNAVYNDAPGEVSSSLNYPNGITQTYRFDKAGDISLLEYTRGENQLSQFSYDFNVAGNITGITTNEGIFFDSVRPKAGYNALNQITSWNGQSDVFDYDADGNLIAGLLPGDIPFEAEYDAENRLTSIRFSKQGKQIEERFTYNYQHMLVKYQRYEDNKLTQTKQFVRLGLIELQERDESGVILAQNVWRPDYPGGVGGLLLRKQGEEYQYFLTNHLGHVYGVFNQKGERITTHSYSPYGEVNGDSFQSQPFGLSTKRSDFESGLIYFGYRFYMPNLGRWLNRDPLHEQGGINLYTYVKGDPLGYVDPDGRFGIPGAIWGGVSGAVGGYITSGNINGVVSGTAAGALVGLFMPTNSMAAGATAAASASAVGQGVGNLIKNKSPLNPCNYDWLAIAGAGAGGGVASRFIPKLIKAVSVKRYDIIGRDISLNGISQIPGKIVGAVVEGSVIGVGELGGSKL